MKSAAKAACFFTEGLGIPASEEGFGEPWFPQSSDTIQSLIYGYGGQGLGLDDVDDWRCSWSKSFRSGDGDDFGVMEQAVEDGAGRPGRRSGAPIRRWDNSRS